MGPGEIAEWAQYGNGPAHTWSNEAYLGAEPWTLAWTREFQLDYVRHPAVSGQVLVQTGRTKDDGAPNAKAYDTATGATLWDMRRDSYRYAGPPSIMDGSVVFRTGYSGQLTGIVTSLDLQTGALQWAYDTGVISNPIPFPSPTAVAGKYYLANDVTSLLAINATGSPLFKILTAADSGVATNYQGWAASVQGDKLYTAVVFEFRTADAHTGQWESVFDIGSGVATGDVPALTEEYAIITNPKGIYCYTLADGWLRWSNATYVCQGPTAVSDGWIYIQTTNGSGQQIRSFRCRDGLPGPLYGGSTDPACLSIIATGDSLLTSSPTETRIYSLETSALTQTIPVGGYTILAGDRVFIQTSDQVQAYSRTANGNQKPIALPQELTVGRDTLHAITLGEVMLTSNRSAPS